ncbi:MAG: AraC family transcriptional regulator [Methylorubrum populi]
MENGIAFWRDSALGVRGVDLLVAHETGHQFPEHFHDEFVVSVFEAGCQRHRISNRESFATPGSLVVIRPGEPHTGEPAVSGGKWSHRAFYPDAETLTVVANATFSGRETSNIDLPSTAVFDNYKVNDLIAACHQAICHMPLEVVGLQHAFMRAMELLLVHYLFSGRSRRKTGFEPRAVQAAVDCMRARLDETDLSVADIAESAGLSRFYFMRSFRKTTGMSVHKYLTQIRLNAARGRLARGESAADVACNCGFYDQSHLIRHFRLAYGTTPGRYTCDSRRR